MFAPKLWILGPQESIFQHILEPEAALRLLPQIQQCSPDIGVWWSLCPKFHSSTPSSLEGVCGKPQSGIKRLFLHVVGIGKGVGINT